MTPHLVSLFDRQAFASFDQQLVLSEIVGNLVWSVDFQTGLLSFENQFFWKVQVLGTESQSTNTLLWAWANESSQIPSDLLHASLAMRGWGHLHQIPEFTEPEIPLGEIDGHYLAMIASGICQANAYYRAPHDGGAAFLLIKDEHFPRSSESPLTRVATVFPQAISSLAIRNHKLALTGYLDYYCLPFEKNRNEITVQQNGKQVLTATFDGQDRLTELKAMLGAESEK